MKQINIPYYNNSEIGVLTPKIIIAITIKTIKLSNYKEKKNINKIVSKKNNQNIIIIIIITY